MLCYEFAPVCIAHEERDGSAAADSPQHAGRRGAHSAARHEVSARLLRAERSGARYSQLFRFFSFLFFSFCINITCRPTLDRSIGHCSCFTNETPLYLSVCRSQVCSLLRGSIAERGGVRVGHRIIEINSQSVVAVSHERIVQILSSAVGEVIFINNYSTFTFVGLCICS